MDGRNVSIGSLMSEIASPDEERRLVYVCGCLTVQVSKRTVANRLDDRNRLGACACVKYAIPSPHFCLGRSYSLDLVDHPKRY